MPVVAPPYPFSPVGAGPVGTPKVGGLLTCGAEVAVVAPEVAAAVTRRAAVR